MARPTKHSAEVERRIAELKGSGMALDAARDAIAEECIRRWLPEQRRKMEYAQCAWGAVGDGLVAPRSPRRTRRRE
jgi:hypothetical protein